MALIRLTWRKRPPWKNPAYAGTPPSRPDIRPQLRQLLAWYEDVLGKIEAGAIVAKAERERLREEAALVTSLLSLLDDEAAGHL